MEKDRVPETSTSELLKSMIAVCDACLMIAVGSACIIIAVGGACLMKAVGNA